TLALWCSNDHLGVQSDQRGGGVRRIDGYATVGIENRVLAIQSRWSIRVANVAAGSITRPAASVIPATGILGDVAADCSLIANLRRGSSLRRIRQDAVFLPNRRMADHFAKCGHGANFKTIAGGTHAAQFFDLAQIDDHFGPLDPILEPVKAVEAAGQHPGLRAVTGLQR